LARGIGVTSRNDAPTEPKVLILQVGRILATDRHHEHQFAVWAKRLEEGTYAMPFSGQAT
jgi:hypothetical protein